MVIYEELAHRLIDKIQSVFISENKVNKEVSHGFTQIQFNKK